MASETVENYLKAILTLCQESPAGEASITRIAALVGVTPGTATAMVKKLAVAKLATYEKYGAVRLTAKGSRSALDVLRRHRIVELFLVRIVGLDWSEVHAEAERMEHAISPKVLDRLDEMLGRPEYDPHGDPIPDAAGRSARGAPVPLGLCQPGQTVVIGRIRNQSSEFLKFIDQSGLRPGSRVVVEEASLPADSVVLRPVGRGPVTLSKAAANQVMCEVV